MRRFIQAAAVALVILVFIAPPAPAGIVDFAIGAHVGANLPLEDDACAGTVLGARLRVMPPIPLVAFEAWYAHFGYEDPEKTLASGDLSLAVDGDGFNLGGVSVLIGGARGAPGFNWFGVIGVNAPEFKESGRKELKLGGELGFGIEITPPVLDLGIEGRGTVLLPDLSGDFNETLLTVTVGVNYYF